MSSIDATQLYGQEHVRRYRETDGEVGHDWKEGAPILLLTTTGRRTGNETTTPLIYNLDGIPAGSRTSPRRPRSGSRSRATASGRVRAWPRVRSASGCGS